ncbi:MAG: hypothetical protein ACI9IA_000388 [Enterobacterales bacterium]|jgi:hypothetical protein
MINKTLLVVSDKFHHFATRKDVITISELYSLLNSEKIIFQKLTKTLLIPGQGFSEESINNIKLLAHSSLNSAHFNFSMWNNMPKRASKQITHKYKNENILISEPQRQSNDTFSMNILINENCEMMQDHQTGLHVQGILLLEASRQGFLAIFEKFFSVESAGKLYFIFNSLHVNYNRFAFPLPATLAVSIRELDLCNSKKQRAVMDMRIMQCGSSSASFSLDMTMMASTRISSMESKLATQSLNDHINYLLNEQVFNEVANA